MQRNRATHLKEIEMMQQTITAARVPVPPSRAGPSRRINLGMAILALSVAPNVGAQAANPQRTDPIVAIVPRTDSVKTLPDSATSAAKTAAAIPKWFDEIAVNAFVSSAFEYNDSRRSSLTVRTDAATDCR